MNRKKAGALIRSGVRKQLPARLEDYLEACRPPPGEEGRRSGGKLPNLAGFCRFLECGISDMEELRVRDRGLFERICATLEDELLNHTPSPTLLGAYLKKRLGYGESERESGVQTDCGQMRLIFEHDIEVDGE